jgi:hypothetical protein
LLSYRNGVRVGNQRVTGRDGRSTIGILWKFFKKVERIVDKEFDDASQLEEGGDYEDGVQNGIELCRLSNIYMCIQDVLSADRSTALENHFSRTPAILPEYKEDHPRITGATNKGKDFGVETTSFDSRNACISDE